MHSKSDKDELSHLPQSSQVAAYLHQVYQHSVLYIMLCSICLRSQILYLGTTACPTSLRPKSRNQYGFGYGCSTLHTSVSFS